MPKIDINAAPNVSSLVSTRRASGADFGGGAELIQAGKDITAFATEIKQQNDRATAVEIEKGLIDLETDMAQYNLEAEENAEAGGAGHVENIKGAITKSSEKFTERFSGASKENQQRLSLGLARFNSKHTIGATRFQAVKKGEKVVADVVGGLDTIINNTTNRNMSLEDAEQFGTAILDAADLPENLKAEMLDDFFDRVGTASFTKELSDADTSASAEMLLDEVENTDYWSSRMSPQSFASNVSKLRNEIERLGDSERTAAFADMTYQLENSAMDGSPLQFSLSEYLNGVKPGDAAGEGRAIRDYKIFATRQKAIATILPMSAPERAAHLNNLEAKIGTTRGDATRALGEQIAAVRPLTDENYNVNVANSELTMYSQRGGEPTMSRETYVSLNSGGPQDASRGDMAGHKYDVAVSAGDGHNFVRDNITDSPKAVLKEQQRLRAAYGTASTKEREVISARLTAVEGAVPLANQIILLNSKEAMEGMSATERAAKLRAVEAEVRSLTGEDKVDAATELQIQQQAAASVTKAYKDDNATAIHTQAPETKGMYDAVVSGDPNPDAAKTYADRMRAEAKRNGQHPSQVNLLPTTAANALAADLNAQMTDAADPQRRLQLLQDQAQRWGDEWPMVARQLADDDAMTPMMAMATRMPPGSNFAKDILVAQQRHGTGDKPTDFLSGEAAKNHTIIDVNNAVRVAMADVSNALDDLTKSKTPYGQVQNVAPKMAAYYLSTGKADSPAKAAEMVVQKLVLDKIEPAGTFFIPRTTIQSEDDVNVIKMGTYLAQDKAYLPDNIVVPSDATDRDAFVATVSGNGTWRTSEGAEGVTMVAPNGNRIMVEDVHGNIKPYTLTWNELRELHNQHTNLSREERNALALRSNLR